MRMENSWLVHVGVVNADWLDLNIMAQGLIPFSIDRLLFLFQFGSKQN